MTKYDERGAGICKARGEFAMGDAVAEVLVVEPPNAGDEGDRRRPFEDDESDTDDDCESSLLARSRSLGASSPGSESKCDKFRRRPNGGRAPAADGEESPPAARSVDELP